MNPRGKLGLLLIPLLLSLFVAPVHADKFGPYDQWRDINILGLAYPGSTLALVYQIVNSEPSDPQWLDSLTLETPWREYYDADLPIRLEAGEGYYDYIDFDIPFSQEPGEISVTVTVTSRYWTGSRFAAFNPGIFDLTLTIYPSPFLLLDEIETLQQEITSIEGQRTSLQTQLSESENRVTSLEDQLAAAREEASSSRAQLSASQKQVESLAKEVGSLEEDLAAKNSEIQGLQAKLDEAESDLETARTSLARTEGELTATKSTLDRTKSELSTASASLESTKIELINTQSDLEVAKSQLGTFSTTYLPIGIGIPAIAAALLAFQLFRRSRPSTTMAEPSSGVQPAAPTAPQTRTPIAAVCPNCGAPRKHEAKFCSQCGTQLT